MVNYDDYGSTAQDDDSGVNQKWTPTKGSIPGISSAEASNGQGLWNHPAVQGALDYLFPPAKEKDDKGPSGPRTEDVQKAKKMATDNLGAPYMGKDVYPGVRDPAGTLSGRDANAIAPPPPGLLAFRGNQGFAGDPIAGPDPYTTLPKRRPADLAGPTGEMGMIPAYAQAGPGDRPSTPLPSEPDKGPTPRAGVDPGVHEDSLLGKYLQWRGDNRQTLAALSQGLLNVGFHQNAFSGMPQAAAGDTARSDLNQTAAMLTRAGYAPDLALALSRSPQAMQAVLENMAGLNKWEFKTMKGEYGQDVPMLWNPHTQEIRPINFAGGGANAGGGAGGPSGTPPNGMPTAVNHDLPAEEFMAQFPQPVQAAARAHIAGDLMPSGNPRNNTIASMGRDVAREYASKRTAEGTPTDASDTAYQANRKMAVDLESSGNSSMGGIISNGLSGLDHLSGLSGAMAAVHSYSGPNILGGSMVGGAGNAVRNTFASPELTAARSKEAEIATNYGPERQKFYSGSPGAAEEREKASKLVSGATTTSAEKAGFVRGDRDMMLDRMDEKLSQMRGTGAGNAWFRNQVHQQALGKLYQNISNIDKQLASLDPNGAEARAIKSGTHTPGQAKVLEMLAGTPALPGKTAQQQAQPESTTATPQQQRIINSKADFDKLPSGATFVDENGKPWKKP